MFPMFIDPRKKPTLNRPRRDHHQYFPQCHPFNMPTFFVPLDSTFELSNNEYSNNYEEWMNNIYPEVIDVLQHIIDKKTKIEDQRKEENKNESEISVNQEKNEDKQKKENKFNSSEKDAQPTTKPKDEKKRNAAGNPTENNHSCSLLQDIFNHTLFPYQNLEQPKDKKWETKIDCHGFLSSNIKVKINKNELLIKAFRKQESKDGLRTMTMTKNITLPDNIDPKQISCMLSPSGFLHVKAPYVKTTPTKENKNKLVLYLLDKIIPELATLVNGDGDESRDESQTGVQHKEEEKESIENANIDEKNNLEQNMEENQCEENPDSQNLLTIENKTEIKDSSSNTKMDEEKETISKSSETNNVSVSEFQVIEGKDEVKSHDVSAAEEVEMPESEPVNENPKDEENTPVTSPAMENVFEHLSEQTDSVHDVINCDDESGTSEDSFVRLSEFTNDQDTENPVGFTALDESKQQSVSKNEAKCDEETENVVVRLEMPCYDPQTLNVSFDEDSRAVTISASKGEAGSKSYSMIKKSITIDDNVDTNRLHCFFKDGALTVTAPSKIKSNVQHIPISF